MQHIKHLILSVEYDCFPHCYHATITAITLEQNGICVQQVRARYLVVAGSRYVGRCADDEKGKSQTDTGCCSQPIRLLLRWFWDFIEKERIES